MNATKKIIKKVRATLTLSDAERAEWVAVYESTGKLPQINIPCSKCNLGITAGHENLRKKVVKYKGIDNLLKSFVCKSCKEASAPTTRAERPAPVRRVKTPSNNVLKRDHTGKFVIPQVKLIKDNPVYTIVDIAKSKELTQEFTNGSCMQPHVYLNNDSTCDACPLYDNCGCSMKNLSRAMQRKLAAEFR